MSVGRIALAAALAALALAAGAGAKDFERGDLRVCDRAHCVPVVDRGVLRELSAFYYGNTPPAAAPAPRLGAPTFELRFRNGYATGIAASAALDRFLSYGVNLGRFQRATWYRVPPRAAAELRRLARGLAPLRLTAAAIARSR